MPSAPDGPLTPTSLERTPPLPSAPATPLLARHHETLAWYEVDLVRGVFRPWNGAPPEGSGVSRLARSAALEAPGDVRLHGKTGGVYARRTVLRDDTGALSGAFVLYEHLWPKARAFWLRETESFDGAAGDGVPRFRRVTRDDVAAERAAEARTAPPSAAPQTRRAHRLRLRQRAG